MTEETLKQPMLVKEYVIQNKRSPAELTTAGDKKFHSLGLLDSCDCHDENVELDPVDLKILNIKKAVETQKVKSCVKCDTRISPFWWDGQGLFVSPNAETTSFMCQSCMWSFVEKK